LPTLLDKRLLFVTGKGGVGKSTVAAALGVAATRRGKRTIICEVAQQERMSQLFEHKGVGYHETQIAHDLYAFSVDPQRALEEYLLLQIKVRPLYELMFKNRIFTYFAAATPGLRELVTVGKIWELAQLDRRVKRGAKYDLVIVDAPATGHGLGLLRTPKTFGDIARVGPIKRQADTIYDFVTDRDLTGVCAVAWPEEMPVNETLDLERRLWSELGMKLDGVFLNGLYPELFDDSEAETVRGRYEATLDGKSPNGLELLRRAALRAALSEYTRARSHREQLTRLEQGTGRAVVQLPFLFEPRLDMAAVELLADRVEEAA
jgi:anion-transporting  ArsA/GET3 family ATPase